MKNLPPTIKYLLPAITLIGSIIILSCAGQRTQGIKSDSKVTIDESGILIGPGTKLSESDEKAMNNILKNYDKSLYRIEVYENGKLKKTRGNLSDVVTEKKLASEIATNMKGFSKVVHRISGRPTPGGGVGSVVHQSPSPSPVGGTGSVVHQSPSPSPVGGTGSVVHQSPSPSPVGGTGKVVHWKPPPGEKDSQELINRLKPILEKYSKG